MPTPMKIYGVVGHFSTDFGPNITLDTAPGATPTEVVKLWMKKG